MPVGFEVRMTYSEPGGKRMAVDSRSIVRLALIVGMLVGCNCSKNRWSGSPDQAQTAADAAGASFASQLLFRCAPVIAGAQFALGSAQGPDDEDDSGLDVPFGINVGQAMGFEGGFVVSAIDGRGGKSHAILGILGPNAENGRRIDLGRVYGDADPPGIAGNARNLVAALADMDAAGRTLRLVRIDELATAAKVTSGTDVSVSLNPLTVFSIAVNSERGVVVWEEPDGRTEKGHIVAAPFAVQNLAMPKKPLVMSGRTADAESPRVVSRSGGFWLAWVQSGASKPSEAPAKRGMPTAGKGSRRTSAEDEPMPPAVDLGTRDLYAVALDVEGHTIAKPLRVTEGASHVVAYDLAVLDDGTAILAWRDDDTSPGVESQVVHVGHMGLDGHVEHFRIEDDSIGVGAPQLLVDTAAGANDKVWLAVGNTGEKVSMARLQPNGNPTPMIVGDTDLGVSNPLVRFAGSLLVARQRGKDVDLEPLKCSFND